MQKQKIEYNSDVDALVAVAKRLVRTKGQCRIWKVGDPSPVRAVGIRSGDVITYANGHEIRSFRNLVQAIYTVPAGETVQLVLKRHGRERGYEIVLARSGDLGSPVEDDPPYDPEHPFEVPSNDRWPWKRSAD